MIIKKKYTNANNNLEEIISNDIETNIPKEKTEIAVTSGEKVRDEEQNITKTNKEITQQKEPEISEPPEPPKPKTNNDLDFIIDNITFEQREERREGTRRRGYRRSQDRNIISRAQSEALSIKEAAKQEGYLEGINKATEDIAEIRNKFSEFFNCKDEVYDKVSGCILEIALEIAKKIINKTVETDETVTLSVIKGAIEEINKTENKIILKVMPKDVEIVKDKIGEIFTENSTEAKISVIPDNNIKEGGVIIETSNGIIDATLETQLSIMEKALSKNKES